jgi:hypothetical protein
LTSEESERAIKSLATFDTSENNEKEISNKIGKDKAINLIAVSGIANCNETRIPYMFSYTTEGDKKPASVQICGSFDKWQVRHPLTYDPLKCKWSITLKIKKGKYYYKYIVDGQWVLSKHEKSEKDSSGILNNVVSI